MTNVLQLVVSPGGQVRFVYGEAVDLAELGEVTVRRASNVEPDGQGGWRADLCPVDGPQLGPFARRSDALRAEVAWLAAHWLVARSRPPRAASTPSLPRVPPVSQPTERRFP